MTILEYVNLVYLHAKHVQMILYVKVVSKIIFSIKMEPALLSVILRMGTMLQVVIVSNVRIRYVCIVMDKLEIIVWFVIRRYQRMGNVWIHVH